MKTALLRKEFVNSVADSKFIQDSVVDLNKEFALKRLGELSYFLRLTSHKTEKKLMLCQTKYFLDLLEKTTMGEAHPCSTPMAVGTKLCGGDSDLFKNPFLYKNTVGALQYITLTRPDVDLLSTS